MPEIQSYAQIESLPQKLTNFQTESFVGSWPEFAHHKLIYEYPIS